jgi:uncharacterized protein YraI
MLSALFFPGAFCCHAEVDQMLQGSSRRMWMRVRVSLFTVILPLAVALGLVLFGVPGARATQILVHGPLSLYGGPGEAFSVLATVAAGAKVEVLWCNAEASWCLVQNGAAEGWAPRDALVTKGGGGTNGSHTTSGASTDGATASIVGPSPPATSSVGTNIGASPGSAGVSAGVSIGDTKLGVAVH